MSLTSEFNSDFKPRKINGAVLALEYEYQKYYYDFQSRLLTTVLKYSSTIGGVTTTPFAQLDREVLTDMRDKLMELGGKPPELPQETPANPGNARKLQP